MHGLSIQESFKALVAFGKISSFVAGILCLVVGLPLQAQPQSQVPAPATTSPAKSAAVPPIASPAYDTLTLREKVGQLFIWTYGGSSFNPYMARWLKQYQPGA